MNAVKVDEAHRIHLGVLRPGDYYELDIRSEDEITLRRVQRPQGKMTKAEAMAALEASPLRFESSWDDLKKITR